MVGKTTQVQVTTVGNPAVDMSQITGIPGNGTGLAGEVYVPGTYIGSIDKLNQVIAAQGPDLTFTATELFYGSRKSDTSVTEFLAQDAASLSGDGTGLEMGPSGLAFHGYIYIPPGTHTIAVRSDDGFDLNIGGIDFTEYKWGRGTESTEATVDFDGGLYQIDLLYFDQGGAMSLSFEIDGYPVDQSAFYLDPQDFLNPDPATPIVPVAEYHPSLFLGTDLYDGDDATTGTAGADVIDGLGGDDTIDGGDGDDDLFGNYGNDILNGGAGNDVLDGGRGMDLLIGGDGDDLLISRSDAGEQRIGQLAIGAPTRGDPDGEVNQARQKLAGWEDMPLKSDDIMVGGAGKDTFLIQPLINAKLDIIQKHVRADGSINWAGVAGENNELHDHWVDAFGIDVIADYVAGEDKIAVIGHTANVSVTYRDTDGDGDEESIITVISNQHGGGGAHDQDLLGQVIVHGDRVDVNDIETDAGVTYGIVQTYADVAEAINPAGELKVTNINGQDVYGYDTRDANGNNGAIIDNPETYMENPYAGQVTTGDPATGVQPEPTRYPFDQLGETAATAQTIDGTMGDDDLSPAQPAAPTGLPGALGFWSFTDTDGSFADARGGPTARAHTLYENQARLRQDDLVDGPGGTPNSALHFNGKDQFAFIDHDKAYQVSQGTIALWVQPENFNSKATIISKDQSGTGDGGHFRLGHTDDGSLFLRMAPGDGGHNRAWETKSPILTDGDWAHLAVNFTASGVTVYVDGVAVPNSDWKAIEGNTATPGTYKEAYMLANTESWVVGADSYRSKDSDTAAQFAADDDRLDNAFEGAIADIGIWGGMSSDDVLTQAEIQDLIANGPGNALTNPSGPQPATASDDVINGKGGDDTIDGGAGDDVLNGGMGDDEIQGGYGDDQIDGGNGDDTLDGGWGSDLVVGGAGDDVLVSRADVGEDRAGQLVLGQPSRPFPDASISDQYLKLYDWIDQPLIGDDVFVGGEGRDHFKFETLINGKFDMLLDNMMTDSRMIHWHGVAGENARIHDHWVDGIGIDIIADYNKDEDTISVIGHTTQVKVDYKSIDSDGDGADDSVVSIITAYSQQGNNGGAHDEDYLGYIVVHGDMVDPDDILTDAGAHYGVVDTIDQLQTALAPTGDSKVTTFADGTTSIGYDTRDIAGDPMGSDPEAYSDNPFLNQVTFADQTAGSTALGLVMSDAGGSFDGTNFAEITHTNGESQTSGTWAFSFTADTPESGEYQALLSKDHGGYKNGGHLTFYISPSGYLKVRLQSEDTSYYLQHRDAKIIAGQQHHVAFSFDRGELKLYVDGVLTDTKDGFRTGMMGNTEDTLVGASSWSRWMNNDNAKHFFDGDITDINVFDRVLTDAEMILLNGAGGDPSGLLGTAPAPDPVDPTDPDPDTITPDMSGTSSDDRMYGGTSAETIDAGMGNDKVFAGGGDDVVMGGRGSDRIDGGEGADQMIGEDGNDRYIVDNAGDRVIEQAGEGIDKVVAHVSYTADANVERVVLHKTSGDTNATGNDLDNTLRGSGGNNVLEGGAGDDKLRGRDGDDTLKGGDGNDMINGGNGADTIIFDGFGLATADKVRGFVSGEDMIGLDASVFAITGPIEDAFALTTDVLSPGEVVLYDQADMRLYYDANADGLTTDDELIATLRGGPDLQASDFLMV